MSRSCIAPELFFAINPRRGSLFASAPGRWAAAAGRRSAPHVHARQLGCRWPGGARQHQKGLAGPEIALLRTPEFCRSTLASGSAQDTFFMGLVEHSVLLPLAQRCIQRHLYKLKTGRMSGVPSTRLLRHFKLKVNRMKCNRPVVAFDDNPVPIPLHTRCAIRYLVPGRRSAAAFSKSTSLAFDASSPSARCYMHDTRTRRYVDAHAARCRAGIPGKQMTLFSDSMELLFKRSG